MPPSSQERKPEPNRAPTSVSYNSLRGYTAYALYTHVCAIMYLHPRLKDLVGRGVRRVPTVQSSGQLVADRSKEEFQSILYYIETEIGMVVVKCHEAE